MTKNSVTALPVPEPPNPPPSPSCPQSPPSQEVRQTAQEERAASPTDDCHLWTPAGEQVGGTSKYTGRIKPAKPPLPETN
ncbi:hypothetical protein SKAU_G00181400 [Synaphobranchus kaupii]|uniref:Uncharacterized protein n=1 Tax=Synaphobranchus kaupii TaxID=118154 RepID=A0A9Q1FME7_SYNKA|nr:hypothetical protein SKAU_G00181400 [Synaphobranchus kaupii]